jgi:hypothetical protein
VTPGASFHSRFSCTRVARFCSIHCPLVPCLRRNKAQDERWRCYPVSCTIRMPCRRVMRAAGQRASGAPQHQPFDQSASTVSPLPCSEGRVGSKAPQLSGLREDDGRSATDQTVRRTADKATRGGQTGCNIRDSFPKTNASLAGPGFGATSPLKGVRSMSPGPDFRGTDRERKI